MPPTDGQRFIKLVPTAVCCSNTLQTKLNRSASQTKSVGCRRSARAATAAATFSIRRAVVFHTIEARNVLAPSAPNAADEILLEVEDAANSTGTSKVVAERTDEVRNSQSGLFFLANETGGKFYYDSNNLDQAIRKVLDAEMDYYLLAYQPDANTFKKQGFSQTRSQSFARGFARALAQQFLATNNAAARPKKRTGDAELYAALIQPLPNARLNLRSTAFFVNTAGAGNFVPALLYLDKDQSLSQTTRTIKRKLSST